MTIVTIGPRTKDMKGSEDLEIRIKASFTSIPCSDGSGDGAQAPLQVDDELRRPCLLAGRLSCPLRWNGALREVYDRRRSERPDLR